MLAHPAVVHFPDRISLIGALPHEEVLALMLTASLFVLPAEQGPNRISDGIPVAIMEAMNAGVPVVTTEVGSISELVIPGVTGFVVPERDPVALTAMLDSLLADPAEVLTVVSAARAKVASEFDVDTEATKILEFIRSVGSH
jgi:colanic acid/amylovoran biosynthesis glycosyltransferase